MKWDTLPDRFFSDEFLDQLLRDYQIDEQLKDNLHERLERIAKEWYLQQNSPEEKVSPSDVRKALDGLSRDAHALKKRMESANDAVWSSIIGASSYYRFSSEDLGFEYATPHFPEHGEIGVPAVTVATSGAHKPLDTIEVASIISALGQLAFFAEVAPEVNPPKNMKAQNIRPLREWMFGMHNVWLGIIQRKFTRDVASDGEPITEAARFCVDIYKVLDPETEKSLVINEMKRRIKDHNDFLKMTGNWNK